jgi:hypothetical protein
VSHDNAEFFAATFQMKLAEPSDLWGGGWPSGSRSGHCRSRIAVSVFGGESGQRGCSLEDLIPY